MSASQQINLTLDKSAIA